MRCVSLHFTYCKNKLICCSQVLEAGTRMPDEVGYQTHLVHHNQAMELLAGTSMAAIVDKAYRLWIATNHQIHNPSWLDLVSTRLGVDPASVAAQVPALPQAWNVDEGRRSESSAEAQDNARAATL